MWIKYNGKQGIIQVKSFINLSELKDSTINAAGFTKQLKLNSISLAVLIPTEDEEVLEKLSNEEDIEGVRVYVAAIGWV